MSPPSAFDDGRMLRTEVCHWRRGEGKVDSCADGHDFFHFLFSFKTLSYPTIQVSHVFGTVIKFFL